MKRAALICPERREGIQDLTGGVPLPLAAFLGKPFVEHALHGLTLNGVTDVLIFASDRPAEIRDYIGDGSTWGLNARVVSTPAERTVEEVRNIENFAPDELVMILDHLPQAPHVPVIADLDSWHNSRATLLPLLVPGQIGVREISPGVWTGMKTRIADTATIQPPCWIGHNTMIGHHARVGPNGFVENDSLIDAQAEVVDSTVGARTYLGGMTHLSKSIASGPTLANWTNASVIRMTDAFLLSHLDARRDAATGYLQRILAAIVLILTSPVALLALVLAPIRRRPWITSRLATIPSAPGEPNLGVSYHQFPALPLAWARWPRLWRIVTGHFAWTGNPPIMPDEANELESEFDRLWIQAPPALFTAPEAEGCSEPWNDEAKAHAALYATRPTFAWRWRILTRGLRSLIRKP